MDILICDDHQIVATSLLQLLEANGHRVVAMTDSPQGLADLVDEHRPNLCVMDLHYEGLPGINSSLDAIGSCAPKVDVVVLSGYVNERTSTEAMAAGAVAVISKSKTGTSLLDLLEGRRAAPEIVPRPAATAGRHQILTPRETDILQRLADGQSTSMMAAQLDVRPATVRSHVQSLLLKLGVHTRSAAVAEGTRQRLLPESTGTHHRLHDRAHLTGALRS